MISNKKLPKPISRKNSEKELDDQDRKNQQKIEDEENSKYNQMLHELENVIISEYSKSWPIAMKLDPKGAKVGKIRKWRKKKRKKEKQMTSGMT